MLYSMFNNILIMISSEHTDDIMIYLGVLVFQVRKENWDDWLLSFVSDQIKQELLGSPRIHKKIICKIDEKQDSTYTLFVIYQHNFHSFEIYEKRSAYHTIYNFQDCQNIQLRNPTIVPKIKKKFRQNCQQEMAQWINFQLNSQQQSKLCVEVYVNQMYLEQCTQIYQHLQSRTGNYIGKFKQYANKVCQAEQLKQHEFIRDILSNLQVKEDVLEYELQQNDQIIKDKEIAKSFIKQKQKMGIIPLKYQVDDQAGIFFDLVEEKIQLTDAPPGFSGILKDYQKKSLTWMLYRENFLQKINMDMSNVPVWKNYQDKLKLPFQLYSLKCWSENVIVWKQKVQKKCNGGILADQMGLGKTIMMISLILANKPHQYYPRQMTLIIAPRALIGQWCKQIKSFAPSLKVFFFRGVSDNVVNIDAFDIIISTQAVLRNQHKKKISPTQRSIFSNDDQHKLLSTQWFRIIIDEAHTFKNQKTTIFSVLCSIQADYRWCLTGTPIQNSPHDLYFMAKFLRLQPWNNQNFWKEQIIESKNQIKKGQQFSINNIKYSNKRKLKQIFKGIMIRRKKNSRNEKGQKILVLPELTINACYVQMEIEARQYYREVKKNTKQNLQQLKEISEKIRSIQNQKNQKTIRQKVLKRWRKRLCWNISHKLIKLRQLSCHSFMHSYDPGYILPANFQEKYQKFIETQGIVRRLKRSEIFQRLQKSKQTDDLNEVYPNWAQKVYQLTKCKPKYCFLCKRKCILGIVTPCMHIFCRQCLKNKIQSLIFKKQYQILQKFAEYPSETIDQQFYSLTLQRFQSECPQCHEQLQYRQVFSIPQINHFNRELSELELNDKLKTLVAFIHKTKPEQKALVYTSFVGMTYILQEAMKRCMISYECVRGQDSMQKRQRYIQSFKYNKSVKVLIMTLKTGAIGLNLQAANHVFLVDPWWNPSVEEQAISRAHRNGQQKQVQAIKFASKQSIQARILKYGIKKRYLYDSILDIDEDIGASEYIDRISVLRFLLAADEDEVDAEQMEQQAVKIPRNEQQQRQKLRQSQINNVKEVKIQNMDQIQNKDLENISQFIPDHQKDPEIEIQLEQYDRDEQIKIMLQIEKQREYINKQHQEQEPLIQIQQFNKDEQMKIMLEIQKNRERRQQDNSYYVKKEEENLQGLKEDDLFEQLLSSAFNPHSNQKKAVDKEDKMNDQK